MKIVILDRDTLSPQTVLRAPSFAHEIQSWGRTAPDQVAERIVDADIVVLNKVKLSGEVIAAAKNLRLVAIAATGTDNVDIAACKARGIVVSNIRNYAVNTVPEHTFALIFALRRSICAYRDAVRAGRWQEAQQFCFFDYPIKDLAGSTIASSVMEYWGRRSPTWRWWLGHHHIKTRARDLPHFQGRADSTFVYQATACGIDQ